VPKALHVWCVSLGGAPPRIRARAGSLTLSAALRFCNEIFFSEHAFFFVCLQVMCLHRLFWDAQSLEASQTLLARETLPTLHVWLLNLSCWRVYTSSRWPQQGLITFSVAQCPSSFWQQFFVLPLKPFIYSSFVHNMAKVHLMAWVVTLKQQ